MKRKGGGDNVGMEWVVAGRNWFALSYRWSNGGLLRCPNGPPITKENVATVLHCIECWEQVEVYSEL
jgi:hypothetical protein